LFYKITTLVPHNNVFAISFMFVTLINLENIFWLLSGVEVKKTLQINAAAIIKVWFKN